MRRVRKEAFAGTALDLADAIGRNKQLSLSDDNDLAQISNQILNLIRSARDKDITLYGRRTEAMFGYIAASLGKCHVIKQEDTGILFFSEGIEVCVPDYRLLLNDKTQFFVEVKNCHAKNHQFNLPVKTLKGLMKYAELLNTPLKIALYWSRWRIWTFFSPDRFEIRDDRARISLEESLKHNEMSTLGDFYLATIPPMRFQIVVDQTKPHQVEPSGEVEFTIGDFHLFAGDIEIFENIERDLLLYMMLYGKWQECEYAKVDEDQLQYIDFIFMPRETNPDQGLEIVDAMSGMISNQYIDLTAQGKNIRSLTPSVDPGELGQRPPGKVSELTLPLWVFYHKP